MIEFSPFFNHLWQSTLFAGAAALLVWVLRENHAALRYKIWLIASLKFLVPFSLLVLAGTRLGYEFKPSRAPGMQIVIQRFADPFNEKTELSGPPSAPSLTFPFVAVLLFVVWTGGFAARLLAWCQGCRRMRAAVNEARPIHFNTDPPIQVRCAPTLYEPGVFGIFRPVLLLPDVMVQQLTDEQMQPILAHELTHIRRRDNLASAIHVVVEALFWFHPVVWWLGARLIEERERACDEAVLHEGADPQVYAQSILTTCRLCLESPVACVSGVTGADLKDRLERIVRARPSRPLGLNARLLIAVSGCVAVLAPVAAGIVTAPRKLGQGQPPRFEEVTIRRSEPRLRHARIAFRGKNWLTTENVSLRSTIAAIYHVNEFQISGGPDWIDSARFDVNVQTRGPDRGALGSGMLQRLIAQKFHLQLHREPKQMPVYALVVARDGPKFRQSLGGECPERPGNDQGCGLLRMQLSGGLDGNHVRMAELADLLSRVSGRVVVDKTGLNQTYNVTLDRIPDRNTAALVAALRQQLGLEMKTQTAPVEFLVIDHAEPPTANY